MDLSSFEYPYVLDGGHGTALQNIGINVHEHPLWSFDTVIDNPKACLDVHKGFIDAGANVILTNTYHASIEVLQACRNMTKDAAASAIAQAVDLAKKAANEAHGEVHVVGSIGPYAIVRRDGSEYNGSYVDTTPRQVIANYYKDQMAAILATDLQWYALETIPRVDEARIALEVWESLEAAKDKKLWLSFNCQDSQRTCGNDMFSEAVKTISSYGSVTAIGINCTLPQYIAPLVRSATAEANGKPFVVYPNHGEVYNIEQQKFEVGSDDTFPIFLKDIPSLWRHNVRIFGGCCRVNYEHIDQITKAVETMKH